MNAVRNIFKNGIVTGITQIFVSASGFLLYIYIARYMGEIEFGKYNFAMSFALLFIIFQDLGISNFIIREIARKKELVDDYLASALEIKFITSFLVFSIVYISINIMKYPQDTKYVVYLFGIYTILTYFAETFRSVFQAFEKMEYTAFVTIIEKAVLLSLVLYVLASGYGLIGIAYAYIFTGFLNVIISCIICFTKVAKPKIKINLKLSKLIILGSLPFGLNTLFGMMFFKIDTVMLSIFRDDAAVGIYSAAYTPLLSLTGIVSTMAISSIYPVMSRYFTESETSLKNITVLSSKYMAMIGFPICTGCILLSEEFIELLYINQYSESVFVFKILALYIPFRFLSSITGTYLTCINKQKLRTISVALGSVLNIILNLIMIPMLSHIGAGIATVLSEVFLFIIFSHYIRKDNKHLELHRQFVKPIIGSFLMGALIVTLKGTNLYLLVILAFIFYSLLLMLIGGFTQEDKDVFNQITKGI